MTLFVRRALLGLPVLLGLYQAAQAQTGSVGIGTTTPTQTLDVNGQLRVRGLTGTNADTRLPMVLPDGTLGVSAPYRITPFTPPSFATAATGTIRLGSSGPTGMAASGTTVYVVDNLSMTLRIFDAANPAAPRLLSTIATAPNPVDVAVSGTRVYVVCLGNNMLQTFDVTSPTAPALVGSISTEAGPRAVAVSGTTVYVLSNSAQSLQAFNGAGAGVPTLLGRVGTMDRPDDLAVSGTRACVTGTRFFVTGERIPELQLFDVSSPAAMTARGSVAIMTGSRAVALNGTTACVVSSFDDHMLQTFNVAGNTPALVGSVATAAGPNDVALSGTTAYVVCFNAAQLQVFSVAGATPVLLSSASTVRSPNKVTQSAGTIYATSNLIGELQVFAPPGPPRVLAVNYDGSLASVPPPAGTDFIQNQTAATQTGGFNLNGSGTVGGLLAVGGGATVAGTTTVAGATTVVGTTNLNATGTAATNIGTGSTAGPVSLGRSGGTVAVGPLAGTGTRFVTTDASGNLGSTTALSSTDFIQNQMGTVQAGDFNISGNGQLGGALIAAGTVSGRSLTTTGTVSGQEVLANFTVNVDGAAANTGTAANYLRFGGSGNGEGIGSKRNSGGNWRGLDFYTNGNNRLAIANDGKVGINSTAPTALLDVNGSTRLRGLGAGLVVADASGNLSSGGPVPGNLRRAVRQCPVNSGSSYTLTSADIAFDLFKVANGAYASPLTLPAAGTGQELGQELTIYNIASTGFTISGANTDNAGSSIAVAGSGTAGLHAVKFVWDGVWIRVQ